MEYPVKLSGYKHCAHGVFDNGKLVLKARKNKDIHVECAFIFELESPLNPKFRGFYGTDDQWLEFTLADPSKEDLAAFTRQFKHAMAACPHTRRLLVFADKTEAKPTAPAPATKVAQKSASPATTTSKPKPQAPPATPQLSKAQTVGLSPFLDGDLFSKSSTPPLPLPFSRQELDEDQEQEEIGTATTQPWKKARAAPEATRQVIVSAKLALRLDQALATTKFKGLAHLDSNQEPHALNTALSREFSSKGSAQELMLALGPVLAGFAGSDLKEVLGALVLGLFAKVKACELSPNVFVDASKLNSDHLTEIDHERLQSLAPIWSRLNEQLGVNKRDFFVGAGDYEYLPSLSFPLLRPKMQGLGFKQDQISTLSDLLDLSGDAHRGLRPTVGLLNIADLTEDNFYMLPPLWEAFSGPPFNNRPAPSTPIEYIEARVMMMVYLFGGKDKGEKGTLRGKLWALRTARTTVTLASFYEVTLMGKPGAEMLFVSLLVERAFCQMNRNCNKVDKIFRARLVTAGRVLGMVQDHLRRLKDSKYYDVPLNVAFDRNGPAPSEHESILLQEGVWGVTKGLF